jgi:subtilisin family serine protease
MLISGSTVTDPSARPYHRSVRAATFAGILCAACAAAVPGSAWAGVIGDAAVREAARLDARAASAGPLALPLNGRFASTRPAELAALVRSRGAVRVLVGVRRHSALGAVARRLARLGADPEAFRLSGVLAASLPAGAVRALAADPRVAYVERDRRLRPAADPFDSLDLTPGGSGIKYTWAYDEVRAAEALAAAGGGSSRQVAVVDTGVDVTHPELAGRVASTYNVLSSGGRADVTDFVGHGTFVAGLIGAVDGNGVGGKGVAGATRLIAVRASLDGAFTVRALVRGIEAAVARGADVINLSLAGRGFSLSQLRALQTAFFNDVLPVAASGNNGLNGNPLEFPAALVGGDRGERGIGLSVTATRPGGGFADFSTNNRFVTIAAPGAGATGCELGVFSIIPSRSATEWDDPGSCSRIFGQGGLRFAYAEGTSFAAPVVSGIAALTWQVQPKLASEQVAHVLTRAARQTSGRGWNRRTGAGVVDGGAAAALARVYDVTSPRRRGRAARLDGSHVAVRVARVADRTSRGRERAGRVSYAVLVSRDGGRNYGLAIRRRKPLRHVVTLRGSQVNAIATAVCDRNGNCAVKRLGRFRPF